MKFDRFAVFAKGGRIYGAGATKEEAMADAQRHSNIELKLFDPETSKPFDDLKDGELACMPCTDEVARTKPNYVVTPCGLQSCEETPLRRSRFFLPTDRSSESTQVN